MKVVYDAPVDLEPHYAQIIKADKIKAIDVYPKDESAPTRSGRPSRCASSATAGCQGLRDRGAQPLRAEKIEVNQGDNVTIYVTNIEQTIDESHGLGIDGYNINIQIDPGETKTVEFTADKPGVFALPRTNFCSALHLEMAATRWSWPK